MLISPHEQERLLIHVAAGLAKERQARGLRLNYPEAVALITSFLLEGARDGRPVVELMSRGRSVLSRGDVVDGGPESVGRRAGSSRPPRTAQGPSRCGSRSLDPRRDLAWRGRGDPERRAPG